MEMSCTGGVGHWLWMWSGKGASREPGCKLVSLCYCMEQLCYFNKSQMHCNKFWYRGLFLFILQVF